MTRPRQVLSLRKVPCTPRKLPGSAATWATNWPPVEWGTQLLGEWMPQKRTCAAWSSAIAMALRTFATSIPTLGTIPHHSSSCGEDGSACPSHPRIQCRASHLATCGHTVFRFIYDSEAIRRPHASIWPDKATRAGKRAVGSAPARRHWSAVAIRSTLSPAGCWSHRKATASSFEAIRPVVQL
jgi:hypothetical protein